MKKKILVVDDEPDFLDLISQRLKENNYEVITASDGKEGLEKIKNERLDVVLLDILMPKLNGLDTLKKIRKHDKHLPIFIITAYSDQKLFDKAKDMGASGFIVKTGDLSQEVKNINKVLSVADKYCQ
ncbi:MAG: response regulator [Candidatus Omnitrophica bacterium]|nr:response regulator [Candidatus Omnitrophota bacterium]